MLEKKLIQNYYVSKDLIGNQDLSKIWSYINSHSFNKKLTINKLKNFRINGLSRGTDNSYLIKKKNALNSSDFFKILKNLNMHFDKVKNLLHTKPIPGNPKHVIMHKNYYIHQNQHKYLYIFNYLKNHIDLRRVNSILEIGPGYGELARIFIKKNFKYFVIDTLEQNILFEYSIRSEFPKKKILNLTNKNINLLTDYEIKSYDIFILPINTNIIKLKIDLFINVSSFMEMKIKTIKKYFELIAKNSKIGTYFYCRNRSVHISEQGVNCFHKYPYNNLFKVLDYVDKDPLNRKMISILVQKVSKEHSSIQQVLKKISINANKNFGNMTILKIKVFVKNILYKIIA
jgi:putative sugar O-methyltransferase